MRRAVPRGGSLERGLEEIYVPGLEAQLAALRELPPPAGDEREVATVLATIASWIEIVRREGASGKAAVDQALAETNRVGSRYGLTECVSG